MYIVYKHITHIYIIRFYNVPVVIINKCSPSQNWTWNVSTTKTTIILRNCIYFKEHFCSKSVAKHYPLPNPRFTRPGCYEWMAGASKATSQVPAMYQPYQTEHISFLPCADARSESKRRNLIGMHYFPKKKWTKKGLLILQFGFNNNTKCVVQWHIDKLKKFNFIF